MAHKFMWFFRTLHPMVDPTLNISVAIPTLHDGLAVTLSPAHHHHKLLTRDLLRKKFQ